MSLLLLAGACTPAEEEAKPEATEEQRHGLLQFHTVHNLEDDACLARGDCFLAYDETEDVEGWVAELRTRADTPVLHMDRGVPWSALAAAPPEGEDPHAFYAERLDPELLAWIRAYGAWFAAEGRGYLALSNLDGTRDRLADELLPGNETVDVAEACTELGPEASFRSADGSSFLLGEAWTRWAQFLIAELAPDQVALLVEANHFQAGCPEQWSSLVSLYHSTYDTVRADVGDEVELFATLSLPPLLGWDDACVGELAYVPCAEEPPAPPEIDPDACFPGEPSALFDLAEGGRMDVLALSLYPDGLPMAPAGVDDARFRLFVDATDTSGECDLQARLPAWVNPLDQLDRLGWDGPVGLAETSARSCPSYNWFDDGDTQATIELPGNEAGQLAWMDEIVERSDLAFLYSSFLRDYPPLGLWLADQGVVEPEIVNLFNLWPCSGLQDEAGTPKAVDEVWRSVLP